jgi:quinol monooxygenase YgiN
MIIGTLRLLPSPKGRAEVLEILRSIQGPVQTQPGCQAFQIYEEQGDEHALVLVERWDSDASLESHLRSEAYRRILNAIELSGGPPEVSFDRIASSEGMDLIARSRTPSSRMGGTPPKEEQS